MSGSRSASGNAPTAMERWNRLRAAAENDSTGGCSSAFVAAQIQCRLVLTVAAVQSRSRRVRTPGSVFLLYDVNARACECCFHAANN